MRLVYAKGESNKFWDAHVEGTSLVVTFGKIGTKGQTKAFAHDRAEAAEADLAKRSADKRREGYVEEGAPDAAAPPVPPVPPAAPATPVAPAAPAAPAAPVASARYRFYGAMPNDWFEGANEGHAYELLFAEAPSAERRATLAAVFEKRLKKGPAEPAAAPWLWSGRFALLAVGERDAGEDDRARAAFRAMAELFDELDLVAKLVQVVFFGARERGNDATERAAIAAQARPTPGPRWSSFESPNLYGSGTDASLASGEEDLAFEEARIEQRLGKKAAAAAKAKRAAQLGSNDLVAIPVKSKDQRWSKRPDSAAVQRLAPCAEPALAAGRIYFQRPVGPDGYRFGSAALDGSDLRLLETTLRGWGRAPGFVVSPDGKRVATSDWDEAAQSYEALELDLATEARTSLGKTGRAVPAGFAYVVGDRLLMNVFGRELVLFGPTREPVARIAEGGTNLLAYDDRIVILETSGTTDFYGVYGDAIVQLGAVVYTTMLRVVDGRIFGQQLNKPVELVNLRAAYESRAP